MVVGAGNAIIDEDTVAALKVPTRKGEKPRAPVEAPGCFMAATHPGVSAPPPTKQYHQWIGCTHWYCKSTIGFHK